MKLIETIKGEKAADRVSALPSNLFIGSSTEYELDLLKVEQADLEAFFKTLGVVLIMNHELQEKLKDAEMVEYAGEKLYWFLLTHDNDGKDKEILEVWSVKEEDIFPHLFDRLVHAPSENC